MKSCSVLIASLILACGILAGSALAVSASDLGWWVMSGPLALAASIVLAAWVDHRLRAGTRSRLLSACVMASIFLAASAFIALRNPGRVPDSVPLLGAGAAVLFLTPDRRSPCCPR